MMSKEFESQHPRDKTGQWVNKHQSVKPRFELSTDIIDEIEIETGLDERMEQARNGENLDQLVTDPDVRVRELVAMYGRPQDLDILRGDETWGVRALVARHGRKEDLDILKDDNSAIVREAVARHGAEEYVDYLKDDPNETVRAAVAPASYPSPPRRTC